MRTMFVSVVSTCLYQSEFQGHIQLSENWGVPEDSCTAGNNAIFLKKMEKKTNIKCCFLKYKLYTYNTSTCI